MHVPAGDLRYTLHYSSISRNVSCQVLCRVFDSEVLGFLIFLVPAAEAEEPSVDLPATIEQNWCRDDGHEWFPGGFVRLGKTFARHTLHQCRAIVESTSLRLQNPSLHSESTTIPPGQAEDVRWFRQLEQFAGVFIIALWLCIGGEEPVCFATCEGEVFRPLGETEVADPATVYEIQMVVKAIAHGTSACTKRSV